MDVHTQPTPRQARERPPVPSRVRPAAGRTMPAGAATRSPAGRGVLHVVGRLTEPVYDLLGPATSTLAAERRPQAVVLVDDEVGRRLSARLDPSIAVHLIDEGRSPLGRWWRIARRMRQLLAGAQWETVHLHGLLPLVIGAPFANALDRSGTRVYVTPHHSRSLHSLRWLGRPALRMLQRVVPMQRVRPIANMPVDVRAMDRVARMGAQLIESPVADVFFSVAHQVDEPPPTIAAGAAPDADGACQAFTQLAVLLADETPGLRFVWTSPVGERERALLEAAGIAMLDDPGDRYQRARALADAWIFVAPGAGHGFPMALAEAMAVGLPCVATRDEAHRDMVAHDESGLIAASRLETAQHASALLRSPALRARLGLAARQDAMHRFSDHAFRRHFAAAFARAGSR